MRKASQITRGVAASPRASILIGLLVAMFVALLAPSAASATALPKEITENTTLTPAGNPYTGTSTIESGVTLTVEPGVAFKGVSLTVKGTLNAEGTASEPIVVTESNGNYTAIAFEPGSGASVLNHVEISKSGSEYYVKSPIKITKSSPTIKNSTIKESGFYAIYIPEGGSPEIANNTILNSGGYGGTYKRAAIYYSAGKEVTGDVNIHGNYIEKCGGGINVGAGTSSVTATSLGGNTVIQTDGTAFSYAGPELPDDITENTLTGNTNNYIQFGGTINHSLTWSGQAKVRLSGGLTIAPEATLTMAPGVYVMNPNITVKGTLVADGTAEKPIVFTEATEKGKGIVFEPGSGASVLDHAEVSSVGSETYVTPAIKIAKASPSITNSTIKNVSFHAIYAPEGGSPEITNNTILNSGGYGGTYKRAAIRYIAGKEVTGDVNIHGNYVEKSGGGVDITLDNATSAPITTLSENTIVETDGTAFSYSGLEVPDGITDNLLIGNTKNYIQFGGLVTHSMTWLAKSKVRLTGVTIQAGATLTIEAGLYVINPLITVNGTLIAKGTASKPITFTEGPSNGKALTFEPGSGASVLDYVEVSNVGSETNVTSGITIKKSSPTITNSLIRNAGFYAIYIPEGGSPEIANNTIIDSGSPGGTYKRAAIRYNASTGHSGNVNIHDNYVENCGNGIEVAAANVTGVTSTTLSGNVIVETTGGGALSYSGSDIPPDVAENVLVGNKNNNIGVSGTVAQASTWNDTGERLALGGGVTVSAGITLKLTAGVYLISPNITVKGTLDAQGTSAKPVVLTGANETNSGEWKSIVFEPGSGSSVLDHAEIGFGGSPSSSGMIEAKGSHPKITNSTVRKAAYYGIKVTESGTPTIEWNRFRSNTNGLYYSGTGNLSAPNNDWGCANGPKPAGCGNSVTANVNWKPAVQLPELAGHCRGQDSQCGEGADPVSLATGQLSYSHRDLALNNKSAMPLELVRAYSSGSSADTGLGPGWSQTGLASATELASGDVLVVRQDGRQDLFEKTEASYESPSGVTDALAKIEGTFQLTTLEGMIYRFDSSGRIASITDDHGLKTSYGYDANGRLATITDPSSQTLTFSYNGSNHITSIKDSTGREAKYTYSGAGDLATVTDALGGVTEYTYDSEHQLKTIKDPRGNIILKNIYDGLGRIVEQRDGLENLWKLENKEDETIVTEPEGGKTAYGFDAQERVVSEKDQLGNITTTSYDEAGNVDEIVKPGGARWQFGHDTAGNLTSVIDPEEGERSYEYDAKNRLESFTDEREETWVYEWDEDNDLVKITDPAEGETSFTHDAAGLPLTVTDPNEHTTTFTYDTRGNRLTAKDALEHTTAFGYNTRNQLTSTTAPGLEPETYGRNALGDLLSVTTPEGHKTEYAYNANGRPVEITDPGEGVWKISYNAMERPTAYVDPAGKEAKIEYDGNFNRVKVTDRRGKETTYAYDLSNHLTELVRPEGGDWEFDYDARGNRTKAVDPRENATTYSYDLLDRMTGAAEPLEVMTSYEYDPAGNLISFTDPRENTTELVYDELGQLTEVDQPLEKTISFTYDPAGNWLTQTTAAGTIELDYDAANRLEEISEGETALRSYQHDAANRMTGATDPQADEIEIGYDDDGRVVSIDDGRSQTVSRKFDARGNLIEETDGRGTLAFEYDELSRMISLTDPQSKALDFDYDPEGNLTKVELPNGVVTTNEYDNAGRLAETTSAKGETTLESLEYEYDPYGNRIGQVDRLSQETTYEYDALNRLIEFDPPGEGSTSYDYDPAGNRTEAGATTYSFNALNQLTSASNGTTYDYDDAGRLIEVAQGETSTTYGWNVLDELTRVDTGAEEIDYAYDAFGRQVLRNDGSTIRPSHYGDLSDLPILDTDAEGNTTMSYVQGPEGLIEQRSGEATSFPLRDAHGDITTLADGEGEVVSRQTYDPWGSQLSGPSLEMGWLGAHQRRRDEATGLVQMGIRSYDPTLGRFLTEDPVAVTIGLGQLADRYTYAANTPPNLTDLTGRSIFEDIANGGQGMVESFVDDPLGYPRQMVTEAQEHWVNSDSPLANVAGPVVSMVDLAVNPDRLDYYMKSNNLPQKEQLADCYNGGHPARTIGGLAGGVGGFVAGTSSAVGDLGTRAVGVGAVSGGAGAAIGAGIGTVGGCALGVVSGLIR